MLVFTIVHQHLIPYIRGSKKPFVLVSTGTWSVSLNPYSESSLSNDDIKKDTINYMRINGKAVKSAKLLLGNEYKHQVTELSKHFDVPYEYHKTVKFDQELFQKCSENFKPCFSWKDLTDADIPKETTLSHTTYEDAYHQLMIELVQLQVKSIASAKGGDNSKIKRLYVDGGFSDNEVFVKLLSHYLRGMKLAIYKFLFRFSVRSCYCDF